MGGTGGFVNLIIGAWRWNLNAGIKAESPIFADGRSVDKSLGWSGPVLGVSFTF